MFKNRINREDFVKPSIKKHIDRVESNHFPHKDKPDFRREIGGPVIILIRVIKTQEKVNVNLVQFYS